MTPKIPPKKKPAAAEKKQAVTVADYGKTVPAWIRETIETQLAIDAEDARSAGTIGYMTRALVLATLPYKDPKADAFTRVNGNFKLRILAGYDGGIPYGIYPRLLLSWVTTEAVRTREPIIELGDSLAAFLRDVLDLRSTGGKHGSASRVSEQMRRLFGALVTAQYDGSLESRGFVLRNIMIAEELALHEETFTRSLEAEQAEQGEDASDDEGTRLWLPQGSDAGRWKSTVQLSQRFFDECIASPVPIDLRAYKALRASPLAMDIYTWLTYRMSYMTRRTRPIRWEALMGQFGSRFTGEGAVRDFKKSFLKALKAVSIVYPQAKVEATEQGLVLMPSRTSVDRQLTLL
ncbi:MAG: hypothetical protein LC098_04220 [Burkholderiales bacterium]|nr:hypothetical protein [Burkholderiales bacterium]